ncbi:helix-turn-helix transcriptional regulator [Novosphingobium lentum]|uniref:helix-turn-helix transcriptional regulator n=1 Tax=Novosphingobium lentum TaxID=145287 RepID=UPI00082F7529|nr:AraC family transcriptional regulator [Novosphingobium lentum]
MASISAVFDVPDVRGMDCRVAGRMVLPRATVELHHYRFTGPQSGVFRSGRGFLDLALSRRPGGPSGRYTALPRSAPIPMGDIIFIPAGQDLETRWGEGEQRSICCGFEGLVGNDADLIADGAALEASLDVRSPHVRDALMRLAREIECPDFGSGLLAEALMTDVGVQLHRYFRSNRAGPGHGCGGPSRLDPGQLRRIEEAIEQPGKLPSVAELAGLCGVSTRHFFRLFRVSTGQTLAHYAADRRIARAKALLVQPRPPIKEIAWRCGFETPAAFSAAFRKAMGMTPKAFRQTVRN